MQAEIDGIYQEHLAKLGKRCSDSGNGVPLEGLPICPVADGDIDRGSGVAAAPHCGEISRAARIPPQSPSNVSTGKRGAIMDYHWSELAGTCVVNLMLAAVSVVTTYGGLNLALETGSALLH